MSKPNAALQAQLEAFRKRQVKGSETLAAANEARDAKRKTSQSTAAPKKPTTRKPRAGATKAGSDGRSTSDGGGGTIHDWRNQIDASRPDLPLGLRIKQVLDYLKAQASPQDSATIKAAIERDIDAETDLKQALSTNFKVGMDDDGLYFYRPDSNVRNKSQLLELIRRSAAPVTVSEVADAYRGVHGDIQSLKIEKLIISLYSYDPTLQCEVLYPVDMKLAAVKPVDDDVAALWARCEPPADDEDLNAALVNAGMKPTPRAAPKKRTNQEKKRKQRKQRKLRAVTNVHLLHLLEGDAPTQID